MSVTIEGLYAFRKAIDPKRNAAGLEKGLTLLAIDVVHHAKIEVPRKTSRLGRTIRLDAARPKGRRFVLSGTADVNYAAAVHEGTRPRVIVPRPGRVGRNGRPAALAWGGARRLSGSLRRGAKPEHFARRVNHPGSRANPFLARALEKADPAVMGAELLKVWRGR